MRWRWRLCFEGITLLVATITMVAVIYYAFIARRQWEASIEANKTAARGFVSTQRPYVNVTGLDITPIPDTAGRLAFWRISPVVQNSGNTPTRNLWFTQVMGDWQKDPSKGPTPFDVS